MTFTRRSRRPRSSRTVQRPGGGANLFDLQGSFPTLKIVTCVTVSGRVYQDRNLDNTYTTGNGAFDNSDIPKVGWTVKIYEKESERPRTRSRRSGPRRRPARRRLHVHQVPRERLQDLRDGARDGQSVEVGAAEPDRKRAVRADLDGKTARPRRPRTCFPNLSAAASPARTSRSYRSSGRSARTTRLDGRRRYTSTRARTRPKPDQFYVQDTWVDSQGRTNYRFSPISRAAPELPAGKIFLLETLTADIELERSRRSAGSLSTTTSPRSSTGG